MTNFVLPYPDLSRYRRPTAQQLDWILSKGVSLRALTKPPLVLVAHGHMAHDGCFEEHREGEEWLAFPQHDDVIYWQPKSGQIARWNNRCFALGEDVISAAGTFALGGYLRIFQDPLEWLLWDRKGLVIVDPSQTFDRLRDVPIIVVAESFKSRLQQYMRPGRMPELVILREAPCRRSA